MAGYCVVEDLYLLKTSLTEETSLQNCLHCEVIQFKNLTESNHW